MPASDSRATNKAYGLAIEEQNKVLDLMSKTMQDLRIKGKNRLLPFQNGK